MAPTLRSHTHPHGHLTNHHDIITSLSLLLVSTPPYTTPLSASTVRLRLHHNVTSSPSPKLAVNPLGSTFTDPLPSPTSSIYPTTASPNRNAFTTVNLHQGLVSLGSFQHRTFSTTQLLTTPKALSSLSAPSNSTSFHHHHVTPSPSSNTSRPPSHLHELRTTSSPSRLLTAAAPHGSTPSPPINNATISSSPIDLVVISLTTVRRRFRHKTTTSRFTSRHPNIINIFDPLSPHHHHDSSLSRHGLLLSPPSISSRRLTSFPLFFLPKDNYSFRVFILYFFFLWAIIGPGVTILPSLQRIRPEF